MEVCSRVVKLAEEGSRVVSAGGAEFYREVPHADPHRVGLGGALISLVEPHPGHERDFNRWYEDDHFYAGALNMPWLFAGGRYVATRELRAARQPAVSRLIEPVTAGCYLHLFWIAPGHVDDLATWAQATNEQLRETEGRIHTERSHVFTHFTDYRGEHRADGPGPKDYQTLDASHGGVVLEILEPVADRSQFDRWLTDDYLPWLHGSTPRTVAHSLRFAPRPPPAGKRSAGNQAQAQRAVDVDALVVLVHFLADQPGPDCIAQLAANASYVNQAGLAKVHLGAPFRQVAFGTDQYVDELR